MAEDETSGCRFGIELLDEDHRRQSDLLRLFIRLPANDDERETGFRILSKLRDLTRDHFRDEEAVMEAIAYPLATEHKTQHAICLDLFEEIIGEFDRPASLFPFAVTKGKADRLLRYWCDDHFIRHDAPLGRYIAVRRAGFEEKPQARSGEGMSWNSLAIDERAPRR